LPQFYFSTVAGDGTIQSQIPAEFDDTDFAKLEARRILANLASDGLPREPPDMMSVEIYDADRKPLFELRLVLQEIVK
jgi:hypothetical protein